jgi:AcrR family transcriptional regulator
MSSKTRRPRSRPLPKREVTRERILDAADKLFLSQGFTAATVQDIAAEAGFTTGAIYYSFGGKAQLFLAVARRRYPRQTEIWREALGSEGANDIAAAMGAALTEATSEPEWYAALFEFFSYVARHDDLLEETAEYFAASDAAFLEALRDAGVEAPLPLERLAPVLLGLMRGLAWTQVVARGAEYETLFSDAVALLLGARPGADGPNRT